MRTRALVPMAAVTPLMDIAQRTDCDVVNTPIRKRVTDLDHAGGDTGAMQVFASLRDANVVLDGPVGCHVMPAVAVINYTDSVPYLRNVTCSELSENEVTHRRHARRAQGKGRAGSGRRAPGVHRLDAGVGADRGVVDDRCDAHVKGSALFFDSIRSTTTNGSRAIARCCSCGRTASTSSRRPGTRRSRRQDAAAREHHRSDVRELQLV